MNQYSLIVCIVNSGFADEVMEAAREKGATGGTVINARGTASENIDEQFGITVHPEKDTVIILVKNENRDEIMKNLYEKVGSHTYAKGICFALPVEETVGMAKQETQETSK